MRQLYQRRARLSGFTDAQFHPRRAATSDDASSFLRAIAAAGMA